MAEKIDSVDGLTVRVDNNPYRSLSDRELHAVITVTARGPASFASSAAPEAAEVIIVDSSGSMNHPYAKLPAAKRATQAAVEALRDGAHFAVVAGAQSARMLYPQDETLAVAGPATRKAALLAVHRMEANGGTAIGNWLTVAARLLASRPDAIQHALLFTDGKNEHESPEHLDLVLAECAGRFSCDARGIGTDWNPAEVLRIVSALDGQADAVRDFADLETDLRTIMDQAMRKHLTRVRLQIRPMTGVQLRYLKQAYPSRVDLTDRLTDLDDLDGRELDTGAWGEERREYHLCLEVDPPQQPTGYPNVAARVAVVTPDSTVGAARQSKIMLHWTDEKQLSLPLDPTVARVTDQAEMGLAIEAGCAALNRGDDAVAERHFGRAVQLAQQSRDLESLRRLERLVVVEDAGRQVVRLRSGIDDLDLLWTAMRSVVSTNTDLLEPMEFARLPSRLGSDGGDFATAEPPGRDPICPRCGFLGMVGDNACESCGTPMGSTS